MQEIEEIKTTLITAFGSHKTAIDHYLEDRNVNRMYVFTMSKNTPRFEAFEKQFLKEIEEKQESLDHGVRVNYNKINENKTFEMYGIFLQVYLKNVNKKIITDITASHKRVSYIMIYAHNFAKIHFKRKSMIVYFLRDPRKIIEFPEFDIKRFTEKQERFLYDSYRIQCGESDTLLKIYKRSTLSRYRSQFEKLGYLDRDWKLTLKGKMFAMTISFGVVK